MSRNIIAGFALLLWICSWPAQVWSKPDELNIYLNGDFANTPEALSAIERGIRVAFDEIGDKIQGIPVVLNKMDHRGNAARQKINNKKVLRDPQALLVFTGIHSTTIIPNRSYINENRLLTLVPWAAGGPVTRHSAKENWIFRLSVDDSRTGNFFARYAVEKKQCRAVHLLLESSPWGDSNLKSITRAMKENYGINPPVTRFSYDISEASARILLRDIVDRNFDCLVTVANNMEARVIMNALGAIPEASDIQVISHWGVTSGGFWRGISKEPSVDTRMRFLQTCYSFNSDPQPNAFRQAVFDRLKAIDPFIKQPQDLRAQVGFIHAYDLSRLLIEALTQVELTDDMVENRANVRRALEDLKRPVQGLIKRYEKPFSEYHHEDNPNAHEALGPEDFCSAYYDTDGAIYLEQ